MAGGRINFYGNTTAVGRPGVVPAMIGKSTTIRMGDILVRTTSSSYTSDPGRPVVRALTSSDTITTSTPPYAIASMDITTDANGYIINQSPPVTLDGGKKVQYALTSMGALAQRDPDTGYTIFEAWALGQGNLFSGLTQASDVADWYVLDRAFGIVADAASPPINYSLDDDAAAANAPFRAFGPSVTDALFNSASGGGLIFGQFIDSFNGFLTGNTFTT